MIEVRVRKETTARTSLRCMQSKIGTTYVIKKKERKKVKSLISKKPPQGKGKIENLLDSALYV